MDRPRRTLARPVLLKGAFRKQDGDRPPAAPPAPPEDGGKTTGHLVKLPGGDWSLWRWAALRGAGFPAADVLKLSASHCVADADHLLDAEDASRGAKQKALGAVRDALDALRAGNGWDDAEKREPLVKAMRKISKGKAPSELAFADEVNEAVRAFGIASESEAAASITYRQKFEAAAVRSSKAVSEIASAGRFQEAVIWQNRHAFHSAILPLLRKSSEGQARSSKLRQYEELIASYVQRYCVKNDTIGFFGPVGWARLDAPHDAVRVEPGQSMLSTREVYFEVWGMDELGAKMSEDEELRSWVAPRRLPYVHIDGTLLQLPRSRPKPVPPPFAAALQACDGQTPAREIAARLVGRFPGQIKNDEEAYELLKQLSEKGLISWKLELPVLPYPNQTLRGLLERVGDEELRRSRLAQIEELEEKRAAIARAAGRAEELDEALGEYEASFSRLAGASSTRAHGENYAARTLVYEDCRRDVEVDLGSGVLQSLGPPMSLMLHSARWYTHQVAEYYRQKFKEIYVEMRQQTGSPTIEGAVFWYRLHSLLYDNNLSAWNKVLPLFQQRWANIFSIQPGQRRVSYRAEVLRPRVEAAFAAPRPGWPTARHHSPDVMIAASGPEALKRGDYTLVMGELHLGGNTLRGSLFVNQHPSPSELHQAYKSDIAKQGVSMVPPKAWRGMTVRTLPVLLTEGDVRMAVTHDALGLPNEQTMAIASMVVEDSPAGLVFRTRDGRQSFNLHDNLSDVLSGQTLNYFKLLRPSLHNPRITIDRLVVSRESWAFPSADCAFASEKDEATRFLRAREWWRAHDLPRFAFVKVPVELKPFYVDFESSIYIDILSKNIRRTIEAEGGEAAVTFSEMMPTHEQSWLPDAEGRCYTSELRLVAVDPRAY